MAAPHVTGLITYLSSLDRSLTRDQLVELARSTNEFMGGMPMIDAFSAVLEIDNLKQNQKMYRALLDIDDGTPDGNLRNALPAPGESRSLG